MTLALSVHQKCMFKHYFDIRYKFRPQCIFEHDFDNYSLTFIPAQSDSTKRLDTI